jgi:hypothetical protein
VLPRSLDFCPDETLYSVLCRYRARWDFKDTDFTRLIGPAQGGRTPCSPHPIQRLLTKISSPKKAQAILEEHSLLPFFRPFLNSVERDQLSKRFLEGDLSNYIGQFTDQDRYIRLCPKCAQRDSRRQEGVYLRRIHQLRPFLFCPEHRVPLQEFPVQRQMLSFWKDLNRLPTKVAPTSKKALATYDLLLKAFEEIRNLDFSQILSLLPEKIRRRHGQHLTDGVLESLNYEIEIFCKFANLSPFKLEWHLFLHRGWPARVSSRLERILIFIAVCLDEGLVKKQAVSKHLKLLSPASRSGILSQNYPCLNPHIICSSQARVIGIGAHPRKHCFQCKTCGFTYEARVLNGKITRPVLMKAGPALSQYILELWPRAPWTKMKKLTGLTDRQLLLAAMDLRLPLDKKVSLKAKAMLSELKSNLTIESMKEQLLTFFRENPTVSSQALLRQHGRCPSFFRILRDIDPSWLVANTPTALRATMRFPKKQPG